MILIAFIVLHGITDISSYSIIEKNKWSPGSKLHVHMKIDADGKSAPLDDVTHRKLAEQNLPDSQCYSLIRQADDLKKMI